MKFLWQRNDEEETAKSVSEQTVTQSDNTRFGEKCITPETEELINRFYGFSPKDLSTVNLMPSRGPGLSPNIIRLRVKQAMYEELMQIEDESPPSDDLEELEYKGNYIEMIATRSVFANFLRFVGRMAPAQTARVETEQKVGAK